MTDRIFERIARIIYADCGVSLERIRPGDTYENLGMDSLDVTDLHVALEEEFDVELPDAEFQDCETISDLTSLIHRKTVL